MPVLSAWKSSESCLKTAGILTLCPDVSSLKHHMWLFCCLLGFLMNNGHCVQSACTVTGRCHLPNILELWTLFLNFADLHFFSLSVMVELTWYLFPIWERNDLKHVNFWFALFDTLNNILMKKLLSLCRFLNHEWWKDVTPRDHREGNPQCTHSLTKYLQVTY